MDQGRGSIHREKNLFLVDQILILVTVSWLFVIFAENCAIQFASYYALLFIGGFRIIALTGVSVVPIVLAPYFSDDS